VRGKLEDFSMTALLAAPGSKPRVAWETREAADDGNQNNAEADAERNESGEGIAEIRSAVQTFTGAAEQRFTAIDAGLTELRTRLDRTETIIRRPGAPTENRSAGDLETRAFTSFIRRGRESLSAEEVRALRVSDDTQGGVLAPDQFIAELLRNVVLFSPIRSVARVMSTSANAALLPKRTGGMTAQWVGETQTRPETTVTFGQNRYPVCELAAFVDVSNAMLEDAAFDVASELAFEFAEEFGRAEGAAFVNGTGGLSPSGFMQSADVAYTPSGSASAITADGLIDIFHALKPPYRANAVWGMNAATLAAVRKLKDQQNRYLVDIGGLANAPATTLLGRPVNELPDMPDIAGNAFPIIVGDFQQAYRIFDRIALSVLRDPFTQAGVGNVRFHGRRRVAAGVAKAEAIRKLKIATS
jgi:HK97 family phage major capsid protein